MLSKNEVNFIKQISNKKHREEKALFVAEGTKLIDEILQSKTQVYKLYYTTDEKSAEIKQHPLSVEVDIISMEKITALKNAPSSFGVFHQYRNELPELLQDQWQLVLDDIQDPGNLGTIVRIADWFGIKHVVCSNNTVDVYNAKCIQATMGSICRVAIHYTDLNEWLVKQKNITKYAATLHGKSIIDVQEFPKGIIVIGNEGKGISANIIALCNQEIMLPKIGKAESLNAAVATGMILARMVY